MYFSCFAINLSLHAIIYKYLISLSIIISIELYLSLVAKFVNLILDKLFVVIYKT